MQESRDAVMNELQFLSPRVHNRVEKTNTDANTDFTTVSTMVTVYGESQQTREELYKPEECKRSPEMR